jgi:alkanesulfonate monooxygenase SsuD/methylene tetrahydromethanopterin reductase-like flavin-dependent oxidoreductase (luciferase family)
MPGTVTPRVLPAPTHARRHRAPVKLTATDTARRASWPLTDGAPHGHLPTSGEIVVRLGYFAMPMHPQGRTWADTLREDREAVILADRLGFHDAFIGEHLTDRHENVTNSLVFLATLISDTDQIRLGTGTTNLSHMHPALVAVNSAMFDHLSGGRFILGVSPGALPSDAELLGILDEDRNQMFAEAIDVITRLWELDPPYEIDLPGNRFKVTTASTYDDEMGVGMVGRPLQTPRPEIVGTVVAPFSKGVVAMGAKDFHPLSANFLLPQWVATHWPNYVEGKQSAGVEADPADWRIARTVFVADDAAVAEAYGRADANSPYRYYYGKMLAKMRRLGRLGLFKTSREQPDEEVTLGGVLDDLVIAGTPDSVAEQILAFRERTGDFGELVYAGLDWVDPDLAKRSMELMAEKVMPQVNAAITPSGA